MNNGVDDRTNTLFQIAGNKEVSLSKDENTLLRNPCSGWGLYDDAAGEVANAEQYWLAQDSAANKYASFFYIRWRWSEMEPEEGKYAWLYDDNYKKLVQGALDRGLKLAFRIYTNGQDNFRQATPDFVRQAGAKGFNTNGKRSNWTPYIDDTIFQRKLENFIKAFAKEYDDPDKVDFVDGVNVGWWGECSHLEIENVTQQKRDNFLEWITDVYGKSFKKVILLLNLCSEFGYDSELKIAVNGQGYGYRRDGLGSMWFFDDQQTKTRSLYPKTLLIGESCYWGGNEFTGSRTWASDTKYKFSSWRQVYDLTCQQALQFHFNTLDLRGAVETKGWTKTAPDLVQKFIKQGGYRLYPSLISAPDIVTSKEKITIGHQWENLATGVCPNNNPRWHFKYKVAFALIDLNGKIVQTFIDNQSDPSQFLYGKPVNYKFDATVSNISTGKYTLVVALVDTTKGNQPALKLATTAKEISGWTVVGAIEVK
ncbi:MAG TPA: hypothetical protein VIK55_13790 [Paludibacter sp.]